MKKAGLLGTIGAALALCAVAAPAQAATTIGLSPPPLPPPSEPPFYCTTSGADLDVAQIGTGPGVTPYTVPAGGGVITSWETTSLGSDGWVRLRVFNTASSTITPVGESDRVDLVVAPPMSHPTRIKVSGGERLGLSINSQGAYGCLFSSDNANNQIGFSQSGPLGQTATLADGARFQGLVSVSAVVEPDADTDGFGDETQDKCPGVTDLESGGCLTVVLGKPKLNAKKGTATIAATVGGAGVLTLKGRNVAAQTVQAEAAGVREADRQAEGQGQAQARDRRQGVGPGDGHPDSGRRGCGRADREGKLKKKVERRTSRLR